MFFELTDQNDTLINQAVEPVISEYDRMVYLALSEFFFDSGMFSYYKAGIFQTDIVNEKVISKTISQNPPNSKNEITKNYPNPSNMVVLITTVINRSSYMQTKHHHIVFAYRCPKTWRCC